MKNPFTYPIPAHYPPDIREAVNGELVASVVEEQLRIVRDADVDKLRDILRWAYTAARVRKAAERRLARLERKLAAKFFPGHDGRDQPNTTGGKP